MKKLLALCTCVLLVGFGVERMIGAPPALAAQKKEMAKAKPGGKAKKEKQLSGKKTDAKQTLAAANKALAFMIKSARADKALDAKVAKNKPFWQATKKISTSLDQAEKGLAAKNDTFFKGVNGARAAEGQMKVAWQLTNSKNKDVIGAGQKLGHAISILRTDFSKEAARKKKGGELTAAEKQQFEKIKAQQKALLAKIKALEAKAGKDKALLHGLKKIARRSGQIVKAPATVAAFVATLYTIDEIEGLLYGYDYYIDEAYRSDWVVVSSLTTEWETTYAEIATSESYEWSENETSVDIETSEDIDISETMTAEEMESQENFAETESFDMTDAEEEEVAVEENTDEEIDADNTEDDDSMEDDSDDDGADFDGDGEDEASDEGGDDDGGAEDDGGGDDDSGGDEGGGDDDGGE